MDDPVGDDFEAVRDGKRDHYSALDAEVNKSESSSKDEKSNDGDFFTLNKREMRVARGNADELSEVSNEILIVDDNCFNILALQGLIYQHFNLQIDSANDGQQALSKVKQKYQMMNGETYKLILMDFSMPMMDGPTAAKQIFEFLDDA